MGTDVRVRCERFERWWSPRRRHERTVFHDVRKGEFVAFGINGSKRLGQVSVPDGIFDVGERNADFTNAAPFTGNHLKPGTVSLGAELRWDENGESFRWKRVH